MIDLVAVVGPTAAGKSRLGVELADRLGGEIVSADAFAVYRGLDIGTDKPGADLRRRIPHHLIDVADPRERFSAGSFIRAADAAVAAIRARGRMPVIVGGTLFYVRALLWGLFPEPPRDAELRRRLESGWWDDPEGLRAQLRQLDPESAARIGPADRQRILRALEVCLLAGRPMSELWRQHPVQPRYDALVLGLAPPRPTLHVRIAERVESMFSAGLMDEVAELLARGVSADAHAFKAIGYRECARALAGEWSVEQALQATVAATRRLAKRQLTWLRGEPAVEWLTEEGEKGVAQALARVEERRGADAGTG